MPKERKNNEKKFKFRKKNGHYSLIDSKIAIIGGNYCS